MKTRLHDMVAMAPDGDGGEGAAPAAGTEPAPADGAAPAPVVTADVARPETLPENYWDAEAKAPKYDALVGDLSAAQIKAQQYDERMATVPAAAADYKLVLPEGFQSPKEVGEFVIPEGSTLARLAPEIAHKHGLPQAAISDLLGALAQDQIDAHAAEQAAIAEDLKALGERGPARIAAATAFMKSKLSPEEFAGLASAVTSAAGLMALEKIIASTGGLAAVPGGGAATGGAVDTTGWTPEQLLKYGNQQSSAAR
mgnify:CR=1 FL=1